MTAVKLAPLFKDAGEKEKGFANLADQFFAPVIGALSRTCLNSSLTYDDTISTDGSMHAHIEVRLHDGGTDCLSLDRKVRGTMEGLSANDIARRKAFITLIAQDKKSMPRGSGHIHFYDIEQFRAR